MTGTDTRREIKEEMKKIKDWEKFKMDESGTDVASESWLEIDLGEIERAFLI